MARSAEKSRVGRIASEVVFGVAGLLAYAIAAVVLVLLSGSFDSEIWSGFVLLVLYPAFNVLAGYRAGRRWFVVIPLIGAAPVAAAWLFGFGGGNGVVVLATPLVLGSLCVAAGVALRLRQTGNLRGRARPLVVVAAACIAFLTAVVLLEVFVAGDPNCAEFKLSPVVGKTGDRQRYDGRSQRVFMADNAVRCDSLIGMTSGQVEAVFGGDAEANRRGSADLDLGYTPTAFGGEYHHLRLQFDRRTRLVDHASRSDLTD